MIISTFGLEFLKKREGYKEESYRDSAGIWTIGYGTTFIDSRKVRPYEICTEFEAERWLLDDIDEVENIINDFVHIELQQHEFDALVSFVYNIGIGGFLSSTLLKVLNKGQKVYADLFLRWNKITVRGKKVTSPGLTNRRKLEYQLFIQ